MINFLWKGSSHSISWNRICKPKLGLRRNSDIAQAAVIKQIWHFTHDNSFWVKCMKAKYPKERNFQDVTEKSNNSPLWKEILRARLLATINA